jgi:hypothetical protein
VDIQKISGLDFNKDGIIDDADKKIFNEINQDGVIDQDDVWLLKDIGMNEDDIKALLNEADVPDDKIFEMLESVFE